MYIAKKQQQVVKYADIKKEGMVFACNGIAYIKNDDEHATNLKTGKITSVNGDQWNECVLYPNAKLELD